MAGYDSTQLYSGTFSGGVFTITGSPTATNYITDDFETTGPGALTYEAGDEIAIFPSLDGGDVATYVGHIGDGFFAETSAGNVYLFTNNPSYTNGQAFTVDAGPFAVCFLAGTLIATPDGERPVETLAIGDIILTADGSARTVRWIGKQSIVAVFASPIRNYPVRIAAGALGEGCPTRDLFLSPDHALLVDGFLAQAGALVNGTTISRVMEPGERFAYYHIETEDHALILAEGAPAETFVDNVSRRKFDNYAEYEALYGSEIPVPELDLPRAMSARQVPPATRARLTAVAAKIEQGKDAAA